MFVAVLSDMVIISPHSVSISTTGSSVKKYSAPQGGILSAWWQVSFSLRLSLPSCASFIITMYTGSFITLAASNCSFSL